MRDIFFHSHTPKTTVAMEGVLKLFQSFVIFSLFISLFPYSAEAVCPTGCSCDDENLFVNCINAKLDIVPITLNPSVKRLIMKGNKIRSLDSAFAFYPELIHVDLSHNHLVRISAGSFSEKLEQLNLNSNKISILTNGTFGNPQNEMKALAVLNLRDNLLDTLEAGVFQHTRNLVELDLGQNSIRSLNSRVFQGLGNLRILNLEKNELTQVPDVFSTRTSGSGSNFGSGGISGGNRGFMPHLANLFLGDNLIQRIGSDAFSAVKNLVVLDLHGCQIETIEPNAFRGLEVLRKLILTNNKLTGIPSPSFVPLVQVEVLRIGRNPFDRLDKFAFGGLKKLKSVELNGAYELTHVEKDAFKLNYDLDTVEMSNCKKLHILPSGLFLELSGLKNLNLKDNSLYTIPEDLASWNSLHSLFLDGNPFHCTCDLLWLQEVLLLPKFENTSSFTHCSEPRDIEGSRVIDLTSESLQCYLQGPIEKTILGVSIAIAIILLALIFFLLYRYHDKIQNACKRCFKRPGSRTRSSVGSSGKDLATKSSFLSQPSYLDEDCREPFMYGHHHANGNNLHSDPSNYHHHNHPTLSMHYMHPIHQNGNHHHSHHHSNAASTLHHHLNSLRTRSPYNNGGNNGNTYTLPNFGNSVNNEYAAPYNPINHFAAAHQNPNGLPDVQNLHNNLPIVYPYSSSSDHVHSKQVPITEL